MTSKTFCVLPFYGFENRQAGKADKNIWCCRLTPNTDIEQVRSDALNNRQNAACQTCWDLENQAQVSERQLHNSSLDFYWNRDLSDIEQQAQQGRYSPVVIKLHTSNICNGTCVTCGPALSTAWSQLRGLPVRYQNLNLTQLSHIDWPNIQSLSFVGGEPLLEKTNFDILAHLLSTGNSDCFISIVTNSSMAISSSQLEILSQFKNLNLCLSIDATGSYFEYLRYPLKWSVLEQNLTNFRNITDNISVSCMISNLSIFCYDQTRDWFKEQNLPYLCKQITTPTYFAPGNLPPDVKDFLLQYTKYPNEVKSFIEMGAHNPLLWQQFKDEIKSQDTMKNISIQNYFQGLHITKIL